jgi:hypothetical protein
VGGFEEVEFQFTCMKSEHQDNPGRRTRPE